MLSCLQETWERVISLQGAAGWGHLVDRDNIPFLALVRNVNNLRMAPLTQEQHERVS